MENDKDLNNAPEEKVGNEKSGVEAAQINTEATDAGSVKELSCSAANNNEIPAKEQDTESLAAQVDCVEESDSEQIEAVGETVQAEDVADVNEIEIDAEQVDATEEEACEVESCEIEVAPVTEETAEAVQTEMVENDVEPDESAESEFEENASVTVTEIVEVATDLVSEDGTPTVIYSEDGTPLSINEDVEGATEIADSEQAPEESVDGEESNEPSEILDNEIEPVDEEHGGQTAESNDNDSGKAAPNATVEEDGKEDNTVYNPNKPRFVDTLFEFAELFVFTLVGVLLVVTFLFRHSIVSGPSMENTLMNKDVLIISDFFYTPKVNDIVIIDTTNHKTTMEKLIVKRIIALEGQTVRIQADGVYVDGAPISKKYEYTDGLKYVYNTEPREIYTENRDYYNLVIGKDYYEITVPEGEIFVLGDHRNLSSDSRQNGTFDADAILGRALFRVYPNFGDPDSVE